MCGIAGLQISQNRGEDGVLSSMLAMLRHRGPDDCGDWNGKHWHIGMTRLSIIDPEHGRQPMQSSDGRWVLVLNGEIYNFLELRKNLVDSGVRLRTRTDTEVLLERIAQDGVPRTLEAVEGMFAFAAVDTHSGDLWLARDRFGEKPLYIDRRNQVFAFCSELTPLLKARDCPRRVSGRGIAGILRYGHPWPGLTAIQGIAELRPSQWLRRTTSGHETTQLYWHPPDGVDEEPGSLQKCGAKVLELLDRSVRHRLVADVPLGLFLSGGIDSASVAAFASRARPDIQAVTVGFESSGYDERPLARESARQLKIRLHEEKGIHRSFSPQEFSSILEHYGQPFHDTSAFPTRAVSRAAGRHFKVVLSGDGGDELFFGYKDHTRVGVLSKWGGGRLGSGFSEMLAHCVSSRGRQEFVKRALELNASVRKGLLPHVMQGVFTDDGVLALAEGSPSYGEFCQHLELAREECSRLCSSVKDASLAMSLYLLKTSFPQDLLTKVDRMSMAESLEVRAPFLDSRLAQFALSLPPRMKVRGNTGKLILRSALRGIVPHSVLEGPKRGFNLPVREWMGKQFWSELRGEIELYRKDSGVELNSTTFDEQVRSDEARCEVANSFRALHRSFLLYSFLLWRRWLSSMKTEVMYRRVVGAVN